MYKPLERLVENVQIWLSYRAAERQQAAHDKWADATTTVQILGNTYRVTNDDFYHIQHGALFLSDTELAASVSRAVDVGALTPTTDTPAHNLDANRNTPVNLRVDGKTYTTDRALATKVQDLLMAERRTPGLSQDHSVEHAHDVLHRGIQDGSIQRVTSQPEQARTVAAHAQDNGFGLGM